MQDVDVLILNTRHDKEAIKRMIAKYLGFDLEKPSAGANWNFLYYRPNGPAGVQIKIDVLTSGVAELPIFHPSWNEHRDGLPVAPLLLVLLHKTLGWSRRLDVPHLNKYKKHLQDATDVINLLELSSQMEVAIIDGILPHEFIVQACTWISEFMVQYPGDEIRSYWANIGFSKSARGMTIRKQRHPEVPFDVAS